MSSIILFIFINFCTTFTLFASPVNCLQSDEQLKGLSDAELAIIGLSPPNERTQNFESESGFNTPVLNPQESLTSSFITYEDSEEEQPIASAEKPFTITFPINRNTRNKQSVQSIVIPLPSDLNDKTGIIVIEDHDDGGGHLDRRTLRAQFFSPTRIKPFRFQALKEEKMRNETERSINRIIVANNKKPQNSRTIKKDTIETKAEPSTTSSVVFDDDIITVTSTFSPESVFRPKSALLANKKRNSTALPKSIHPIIDTMSISLKARQRINKKPKNLKNVVKSTPRTTTTTTTTTTTPSTTTTEESTTTEEFEDIEDIENTETTTFTTPETTTRNSILRQLSLNDRPNVRRRWNHTFNHTINHTVVTTQSPTTEIPTTTTMEITTTQRPTTTQRWTTAQRWTTTQRPTTAQRWTTTQRPTTTVRPTIIQRIITTERPTTERTTTRRRTVPRRRISKRLTTTTTTTPIPTTLRNRRREMTTTSPPIDITEVDYELISLDNSTQNGFDSNSLRIVKPKNRTLLLDEDSVPKPRPPGAPHIPQNFGAGFLPSGKAFNLPHNVPGSAGVDYPTYDRIPSTPFDCKDQLYPGFYADLETGCQVYHSCNGNLRASKHTFLCPNGTIFSQEYLICDWWYNVNCGDSPLYYPLNKEAFSSPLKANSTQTPKTKIKNNKKNKPKTTTTEFVIRTITTTDLP